MTMERRKPWGLLTEEEQDERVGEFEVLYGWLFDEERDGPRGQRRGTRNTPGTVHLDDLELLALNVHVGAMSQHEAQHVLEQLADQPELPDKSAREQRMSRLIIEHRRAFPPRVVSMKEAERDPQTGALVRWWDRTVPVFD